ncbi:MAG: signal peptidase II [Desulfovibrio sp.]|jgi:signal peptidase II|nr:signal peptidase II [Desulfovibrio sp.]
MSRRYRILVFFAVIAFTLDQVSKYLIVGAVPEHGTITVIPGFFDLVNIRNRGAAFGFLNRADIEWQFWLFLAATAIAAWAILTLVRDADEQPLLFTGLGLVLGGAVGNMTDRLRFRAVVDFLDFYMGGWHWPAFNVADMAICAGAVLSCFVLWRKSGSGKNASRKGASSL